MKKSKKRGTAAALIANIIFGFSFLFTTLALETGASPLILVAARFTVAFLVLAVLCLLGVVKINLRGKRLFPIILMGLCQPFLYFIFETYGLKFVSSSISGVIISTVPIAVILIHCLFFGGRVTVRQGAFSALSVVGVIAVSILSNKGEMRFSYGGAALLLLAVLSAAMFNILSNRESENFTSVERTFVMFAVAAVGFNLLAPAVLQKNYISELTFAFSQPMFSVSVAYLAVVSSVAAFLLYNFAASNITVVEAASFSSVISICSVVAGITILKEKADIWQILCCAVIILGVWGVNAAPSQGEKSREHK